MFERIQHLSSAMAAGDSRAVDAFYRQYFSWMYAQARRVTRRDESFCLDVVQDAVLRVMRAVKPVDCEKRFRGWLRLVVQTTAFDLLRAETRRRNREAMAGKPQLDVGADSLQLDWLREQITELDPELANLIELRYEKSWSLRKIGEKTGLTIGAIDGRLRRAMKNLKLAAEEPADVETTPSRSLRYSEEPDSLARDPALRSTSETGLVETIEVVEFTFSGRPERATAAAVEEIIPAEPMELIGLEDEAGAYDDAL